MWDHMLRGYKVDVVATLILYVEHHRYEIFRTDFNPFSILIDVLVLTKIHLKFYRKKIWFHFRLNYADNPLSRDEERNYQPGLLSLPVLQTDCSLFSRSTS